MRSDNKPTAAQLKKLYEAAEAFKQAKPWESFYDVDIICVENPADKQMGYCSIMGNARSHFALGVYLGMSGLYGFYQIAHHSTAIASHQIMHYQDCIMCSFEDRNLLSNEDRAQIKELGLSFRGRNEWPMFRRYEPGFHPWYITKKECVFLTHALTQTLSVANAISAGELKMDMSIGRTIIRYSEKKDGKVIWHSKESQMEIPKITYAPVMINNEILIHRIRETKINNMILLADTCYLPKYICEKKVVRPYYPRISVLADENTEMLIDFEMYEDINNDADVVLNKIIDICLNNSRPKEIHVKSEAMKAILEDLCQKTGIKLKTVKYLLPIDEYINSLDELSF